MAPKRKGGGTKGFLKTAARAGAEPGDDAAPQDPVAAVPHSEQRQSATDGAAASAELALEAHSTAAPAANGSTAPAANGAAAAAPLVKMPQESGLGEGGAGGDETRGQMLQRHKKATCLQAYAYHETQTVHVFVLVTAAISSKALLYLCRRQKR